MTYLHGGERVKINTEDWIGYGTVQGIDEPKSTTVDNGEYVTVKVKEDSIFSGDVELGLITVEAVTVVEILS